MSDDDLHAAEYVLGTLDRAERAAFAARLAESAELRAAVVAWETRFAPLADELAPAPVPDELWQRLARALPATTTPLRVVPGGASAGLRRSLRRWRTATVAASAIAASLALVLADRVLLPPPPAPTMIAAVNRGDTMPALIVRVDPARHQVTVRTLDARAEPGHSLELWYIGAGAAPRSMGVLDGARQQMPMPSDAVLTNATFAVTSEAAGGSPTGRPSGAPVYAGTLVEE